MKLTRKDQTIEYKNSEVCTAWEYPFADKAINMAFMDLRGRYPDTGRVVNMECKEIMYVVEGESNLMLEGEKNVLKKGDGVFIEPGEKYFWDGTATLVSTCAPAWTPEQHKMVE